MSETVDCNNCPTIVLLVANYDKLYNLHKIALYALIVISLGEKLVMFFEKFIN